MREKYFKTAKHFSNMVQKIARDHEGRFNEDKTMPIETYVDWVYNAGLADEFGIALRGNPALLEEDELIGWLQKEKNGGFVFPSAIELVTTIEFRDCLSSLHKRPGCYTFWNESDQPLYVGVSVDVGSRAASSFQERFRHYSSLVFMRYVMTQTASDAAVCEVALIAKHKPALNGASKFDDELTIDVPLPELSEPIQCNVPGRKSWVDNGGHIGFGVMIAEEHAEAMGVEISRPSRGRFSLQRDEVPEPEDSPNPFSWSG